MVRLPAPRMRSFIRPRKSLKSARVSAMARNIPRHRRSMVGRSFDDLAVAVGVPLGARRRVADRPAQIIDEAEYPRLLLAVDLVGRVRHLVIVRMHPVKEEKDGHALPGEV